ncbi:hypothetical protein HAX54_024600 [Datura stramonium]|uniref:Uncharacterized protein n=1 Tax=Datura stramonium TaxID=4076 RepID=A0ABS8UYB2_DATST|nr:hypothetical protein [Datura stramonium]
MCDPTTSNPNGSRNIMIPNDALETFKNRTTIQHDEHITRLTQEIKNLHGELNRIRDLTNLSITLQRPPLEHRSTAPNPPHFQSLDSQIPEHFPPQHPPPTNKNLPLTTTINPHNPSPIYTPPQSQPPTYITYATPLNPPPFNPPNQPPRHIPHISLPANTYPALETTLVNPPNQPLINNPCNPPQPPIQNTTTIQKLHAKPFNMVLSMGKRKKEDVSPVMINRGRKRSQVFPYQDQPHQPTYPYQYVETSPTFYHPPPTPYYV